MKQRKRSLALVCAVLSIFTLVAFHIPFFRQVLARVESGLNGSLIFVSLVAVMLLANYFVYYLLLWSGRALGRAIVAASLVLDAVCLYFINTYDVLIDASMMGNVFNTRYSEASAYFSLGAVLYVLLLGIIPALYICLRKIDFGNFRRCLAHVGISMGLVAALVFANMTNWPWMDRNATVLGSLLMPWSYTVNTVRWHNHEKERNREEILLPDASIASEDKAVFVLIIGESARRDHFSLYGYGRQTNPLLENDGVKAYPARSAATYTTAGVKAILDHKPCDELYEILPNYLSRAGVDVVWRTSNWGEPPLHVDRYLDVDSLKGRYPEADPAYDGILFEGLADELPSADDPDAKDKVLIVIHTSTSHGPSYDKRYPPEFLRFTPVCTTVEMSKADTQELMNAYDNTILYTDSMVHGAIEQMKALPQEWRSCVLFVSDHGESLGEGKLYMHGVPIAMAPKEQVEIPFIVWTSDGTDCLRPFEEVSQYHVFHSVLDFLDVESQVFDPQMDIFE